MDPKYVWELVYDGKSMIFSSEKKLMKYILDKLSVDSFHELVDEKYYDWDNNGNEKYLQYDNGFSCTIRRTIVDPVFNMSQEHVYFCSGYGNLTEEEFTEHYAPQLDEAIAKHGSYFRLITGDYHGADYMSIEYALKKGVQWYNIDVFLSPKGEQSNQATMELVKKHTFKVFENFQSIKERDAVMTATSGHDIQWERETKDIPNYDPDYMTKTRLNVIRRKTINDVRTWMCLSPD
jgi:hypothetical protein